MSFNNSNNSGVTLSTTDPRSFPTPSSGTTLAPNTVYVHPSTQPISQNELPTMPTIPLLHDGLSYLITEHNYMKALFLKYEFEAYSINERIKYMTEITRALCQHMSMEENLVYPIIRSKLTNGEMLYERCMLDDLQTKESLQLAERMTPSINAGNVVEFDKMVIKMILNVLEHIKEEEDVLIPQLGAVMSAEQKKQLEIDLIRFKEKTPTHPHVNLLDLNFAPNQTGSTAIQQIEATFDRIVDNAILQQLSKPSAASGASSGSVSQMQPQQLGLKSFAPPTATTSTSTASTSGHLSAQPNLEPRTVLQHLSIGRITANNEEAKALEKCDIRTVGDLIHAGKTRYNVSQLEKKSGVPHDHLINLIHRADMMRCRGVGIEYGELLVAAGVRSIIDLSRRVPSHLLKAMDEANGKLNITKRLPTLQMVQDWVEQARVLPSIVDL